MLEILPVGAVTGSVVAGFLGSLTIRRTRHLEGRLALLRRQLLGQAAMLFVFVVGVVSASRYHLELAVGAPDRAVTAGQIDALAEMLAERLRTDALWLGSLAMIVLSAVPSVLHVLRDLQTFVLHHRTDLLARDQAAAGTATARS